MTTEIKINDMIDELKNYLQRKKHAIKDAHDNTIYMDHGIYAKEELQSLLCAALTQYNLMPHLTFMSFDLLSKDEEQKIISLAMIMALATQNLIENGREFTITNEGIKFVVPTLREMLHSSWGPELETHLNFIKKNKNMRYQG